MIKVVRGEGKGARSRKVCEKKVGEGREKREEGEKKEGEGREKSGEGEKKEVGREGKGVRKNVGSC